MALLYVVDSADFTFLMNQTGLTWGNLSAHLSKLEEAGYIEVEKSFKGKRPNTDAAPDPAGRDAFQAYRQKMKQVLDGLRSDPHPTPLPPAGEGFSSRGFCKWQ